jgi:hypothetical protein
VFNKLCYYNSRPHLLKAMPVLTRLVDIGLLLAILGPIFASTNPLAVGKYILVEIDENDLSRIVHKNGGGHSSEESSSSSSSEESKEVSG